MPSTRRSCRATSSIRRSPASTNWWCWASAATGCSSAPPTRPTRKRLERIKFATQLTPEWVIVEYDKLIRQLEAQGASANEVLETLASADFDFDVTDEDSAVAETADVTTEVEDAPVVRFLQKMLIDAINMRASDLHFEPYEYNYRVRFRIDGELREITQPPIAIKDKLASRIKVITPHGHRREARAAGRPHETQVRQQGDRLPRQHAAHVVRREDRDPDPRPVAAPSWASRPWATRRSRRTA